MSTVMTSFFSELEKIAEQDPHRRRRIAGGLASGLAAAGGLAYAGIAGRRGLRRAVSSASDQFARKMEAGVRRGVQDGFEQGVKGMRTQAPDMADDVMARVRPEMNAIIEAAAVRARKEAPNMADDVLARVRPELDAIIDTAANRAKHEAPGLGEAVAHGFSRAVKNRRDSAASGIAKAVKSRLPWGR